MIIMAFKICEISKMHFISSFKVVYLNVWGWPVRPEHVACIDETNTFFLAIDQLYVPILVL